MLSKVQSDILRSCTDAQLKEISDDPIHNGSTYQLAPKTLYNSRQKLTEIVLEAFEEANQK